MLTDKQRVQLFKLDELLELDALKSSIAFEEYSRQKTFDVIAGTDESPFRKVNDFGPLVELVYTVESLTSTVTTLNTELTNLRIDHNKLKDAFKDYIEIIKLQREKEHRDKYGDIENLEYRLLNYGL